MINRYMAAPKPVYENLLTSTPSRLKYPEVFRLKSWAFSGQRKAAANISLVNDARKAKCFIICGIVLYIQM